MISIIFQKDDVGCEKKSKYCGDNCKYMQAFHLDDISCRLFHESLLLTKEGIERHPSCIAGEKEWIRGWVNSR
jgi:hypothetical protein